MLVELVKSYNATMLRIFAAPSDAFVGYLLSDLSIELLVAAADIGMPVQTPVVELLDRDHALHETGEFLELGPLVVCDPYWYVDGDRLLNSRHCSLSFSAIGVGQV